MPELPRFPAGRFALFLELALALALALPLRAQSPTDPALAARIDAIANQVLQSTSVPSASVAVVQHGRLTYAHAYGDARLEPRTPATADMRYSIGSISKQFTAAAMLLLQEQGKLSLDDPVARYIPSLARANEVTLRQLLSHTSGYQDFWPQDYVMPMMLKPTTPDAILERWGKQGLDFDPGTRWQYSNTNYAIAGLIVQKVAGQPFFEFLRQRILQPLGLQSARDFDADAHAADAAGYLRYGLGPLRPAPDAGPGWGYAMGELAMTASDLARWDIAMIDETILKPSSYTEMERDVLLKNGTSTGYGLGVDVSSTAGHRTIEHSGEMSGFTAENIVYPDDSLAVVVLTNQDAATAAESIGEQVGQLLLAGAAAADPDAQARTAQARAVLEGLQHGTVDRSLFTDDANFYFSPAALRDFASGLAPLGTLQGFQQLATRFRGGMRLRVFRATFAQRALRVWTYQMPDGKLEQYQVAPQG